MNGDLRNTNPWLARAGAAIVLVLGISATEYVAAAAGASASAGHYPLDRNGGIAVSSANLDRYLATLQERATERQFLLTFGDLLFTANSAQIGDSEKGELVRMADFLRDHPATVAQIVGHADDRADAAGNSRLAGQRAAAVLSYLVVQGIDQSRLTAVSGAEGEPLPGNGVQYERAANRRVEILVQKPEPGQ